MNGYTYEISPETKRLNEIQAIGEILAGQPDNEFWRFRLASLVEIGSDKWFAAIPEIAF